jgi:hypothetical protein
MNNFKCGSQFLFLPAFFFPSAASWGRLRRKRCWVIGDELRDVHRFQEAFHRKPFVISPCSETNRGKQKIWTESIETTNGHFSKLQIFCVSWIDPIAFGGGRLMFEKLSLAYNTTFCYLTINIRYHIYNTYLHTYQIMSMYFKSTRYIHFDL